MADINVNASLDIGKNIQGILEQLAAKIGTTVEQVWPWIVRQQSIEAWTYIIVFSSALLLCLVFFVIGFWNLEKGKDDVFEGITAVSMFCCLVVAFVSIFVFIANVPKLMNPEYYALKELIGMVK